MSKTKRLSFGAILTAMGVVMLFLGCYLQTLDLTVCAAASLIIVIATLELGMKAAFSIYLATSVLSLLLLPEKTIAVMYAAFVGAYPLLKNLFERLPKAFSWMLKILSANIAYGISVWLTFFVFELEDKIGVWMILFSFFAANVAIIAFDILLDRLMALYHIKFRKMLGIAKIMRPK